MSEDVKPPRCWEDAGVTLEYDLIPPGELGSSPETPYLVAPADFHENGVPYGAFCKCCVCQYVGRSTFVFDFYAREPGQPYRCETCNRMRPSPPPTTE